ncbi:MAG: EamA family transporter [Clostridia bacterium]|nr:EamA family transporter [Clostridia bacterium]
MKKKGSFLGIILVLAAGVLWGFSGFFVNKLEPRGVASAQISVMRLGFTFIMMSVWALIFKRDAFVTKKRCVKYFIGGGLGMVGSSIFYFYAILMTSMSVAAVLMYTAPIIVVVLSIFVFREHLTFLKSVCCIASFAGAALVSGIIGGVGNVSVPGLLFGCAAGFSYACYSVFSSLALMRGAKPISVTVYAFGFATLAMLPFGQIPSLIQKITADPTIVLLALGQAIVSCLAPYVLYTIGLKYTDASNASIMSTVELVAATLIGLLAFGQTVSVPAIIGIVLVIGSVVMLNVKLPERSKKH